MEYVKYLPSTFSFKSEHRFCFNVFNVKKKKFGFCVPQEGNPQVSSLNWLTLTILINWMWLPENQQDTKGKESKTYFSV